jgi:DNA-binding transcriptional ArsR family regulator
MFSRVFGNGGRSLVVLEEKNTKLIETIKDQNDLMKMKEKNLNDLLATLQREQDRGKELQDHLVVLVQATELSRLRKYKSEKVAEAARKILSDEEKITGFLRERGRAPTKHFISVLGLRRETVSRKLAEMVDKGLLKREGLGKSTIYALAGQ